MTFDQVFELGYLERLHGVQGEVVLVIDADQPEHYKQLGSIFLDIRGKLIPFFIEKQKQLRKNERLLKLEDIKNEDEASDLVGSTVYLPISQLPPLKEHQYYYHELIGMVVIDQNQQHVGTATGVLETPQQMLLQFDHEGYEVLCPMHDDIVKKIDKANRSIHLELPEGLLDVYKS